MRKYHIFAVIAASLIVATALYAAATASPPADAAHSLTHAPEPAYPADALQRHITGSGIFLLRVNIKTGRVTQVLIGRSTGTRSLDAAAIKALSQWRFKPGVLPYRKIRSVRLSPPQTEEETLVKLPVTFTLKV